MRAVLQRVRRAKVTVGDEVTGEIGVGWLVLIGVAPGDTRKETDWLAEKVANLRAFEDTAGKMNLSVQDVGGSILVVSQFTLYGDCSKGRRPSPNHSTRRSWSRSRLWECPSPPAGSPPTCRWSW